MATPILVTGAGGRVGGVGRTITELLLKQGKPVRAMVRNEDHRAQALRDMGAYVVVGDLLDLDSMHRAITGCETMYFGMSVSDTYLAATVNAAAVAKHHGVKAFVNMSQMTLAQMSITLTTPSPQHKLHWLAEQALNAYVEVGRAAREHDGVEHAGCEVRAGERRMAPVPVVQDRSVASRENALPGETHVDHRRPDLTAAMCMTWARQHAPQTQRAITDGPPAREDVGRPLHIPIRDVPLNPLAAAGDQQWVVLNH
jgi:NAD(P)-dependent dehydrogenase (short-subunit alcohol dehydrogenase family)